MDLSRAFLNTNGAVKHAAGARCRTPGRPLWHVAADTPAALRELAGRPERLPPAGASPSGLTATIGAGTRADALRRQVPADPRPGHGGQAPRGARADHRPAASVMAWGFDPDRMSAEPLHRGLPERWWTSVAKLVAAGGDYRRTPISPSRSTLRSCAPSPQRWGKPFAALLGALDAQLDLGVAAIGGKDSMSGSFLDLDVPPTLISFAIAPVKAGEVLSTEFKGRGPPGVCLLAPAALDDYGRPPGGLGDLPRPAARQGKVLSAWAVETAAWRRP